MRSLREYAQFVGKAEQPISPRTLVDYLHLNVNPNAISLREVIQTFENESSPLAIAITVQPDSETAPFQAGMQLTSTQGYVFGLRWRVLRGGQQIALYDLVKNGGFPQVAHTFSEPGAYTVEATARGIGKDGYAEATRTVTVVAKPKEVPQPSNRLKLILGSTELVPNILRITSVKWKVTPLWNPAQPFNLDGAEAEVTLPNPPPGVDSRVSIELRIRCVVAGVLNGVFFPYHEFDGLVEPFPAMVGLEGKPLTAGWAALWNMGPVEDGDGDPNNNPFVVVVIARLVNIT